MKKINKGQKLFIDIISMEDSYESSKTLRLLHSMTKIRELEINESKYDEEEIEDILDELGVSSTPVVLINGRVSLVGQPSKKQLLKQIDSAIEREKDCLSCYF